MGEIRDNTNKIHVVLLSGGSGTRLWPLSNNARSKQFLKVLRDEDGNHVSMVQRVFSQIEKVPANLDITIATSATQASSLEMQVGGKYRLVQEPERRDTAPAIMLACAHLALEQNASEDDTVIVMPIDTYAEQSYYDRIPMIDAAVQGGKAELVLLGVKPTYPSEKYGYIIPKPAESGNVQEVSSFKEKPSVEEAVPLIEQRALWNCGVFAFKLGYLRAIANSYMSSSSFSDMLARYSDFPKNSFDYEVVEKTQSIAVVPYEGEWKDLGTWNTLSDEMVDTCAGRVVVDADSCTNTHVINETALPLAVLGLEDAVIIATQDGILACSKEASASPNLKKLVNDVAASRPMYERRNWGEYRVLDASAYPDGKKALTKELIIEAGKQLSYQKHYLRSEVWTIVSGKGEVVLDDELREIRVGDVVKIEPEHMHSVRAIEELHIIETQLGTTLVEDDIERFGFFWKE